MSEILCEIHYLQNEKNYMFHFNQMGQIANDLPLNILKRVQITYYSQHRDYYDFFGCCLLCFCFRDLTYEF